MVDKFLKSEIKLLEAEITELKKVIKLMAEQLSGILWRIDDKSGEVIYDTTEETIEHYTKQAKEDIRKEKTDAR